MTNQPSYDVLIAGGGPIGAATAYFLTEAHPDLRVGLVTQDPTDDHSATYLQAGGSLRWHWDDPQKTEMTKTTADFIKSLLAKGVDLGAIEDNYLLLYTGTYTPSLNFSGQKLVGYLLDQAEAKGLSLLRQTRVAAVRADDGQAVLETTAGPLRAKHVLLALGIANAGLLPGFELEREKRQLFVLDLPVDDTRRHFPHVIARVGEGYAYAFIKQTPAGLRYLVGQEDVVEANDESAPEDYYDRLLEAGLEDIMPFLRGAHVERILWGFDAGNKDLKIEQRGPILAANCGSAARSCAWIGRHLARRLA